MTKSVHICALFMLILTTLCEGQGQFGLPKGEIYEKQELITSNVPKTITRNFIQDSKGNTWIAAFDGIFRYDPKRPVGQSFTNITGNVSSARFFAVLEDKKGNFWFSTTYSGVYYYDPSRADGKTFQHFTTKDGLASDQVLDIYEDKAGNIWFGTKAGASRYDPARQSDSLNAKGKSFTTYKMNEGLSRFDPYDNDVNSIVEDKTGKFWFGTRGNTFTFDGEKFKVVTHNGESFLNVRKIIEDTKGNIWLASAEDGLWRIDGNTFTNFSQQPTGYVYEDKMGNIWTSSKSPYNGSEKWALSRFDAQTLSNQKPTVTDVMSEYEDYKNLIFGISEANDGSIWFGTLSGVYRYDGNAITALNK
ncbi:histidine kinase [Dyadobacter chenwenxiniae]|uniref:ligand-binding sensor domain-containing protein n=1 Tax=Dyadobacter chenwenxiniae TaxID=2906456 RepID=UPI001FD528F1|nr:two-component regulator propeller domain-containing protein [Dyadobacter chenwenxiniae]UON86153.1 histidine kinase [Dyadobacter chenwenxiniae]